MRLGKANCIIIAVAAITLISLAGSHPARAQNFAAGQTLAEKKCGRCHAVGQTGKSRLPIATPFRDLAKRYSVWGLQEALAEGIVVGHPAMPKFVLTPDEIHNLLSYMSTLGSPKTPASKS